MAARCVSSLRAGIDIGETHIQAAASVVEVNRDQVIAETAKGDPADVELVLELERAVFRRARKVELAAVLARHSGGLLIQPPGPIAHAFRNEAHAINRDVYPAVLILVVDPLANPARELAAPVLGDRPQLVSG